MTKGSKSHSSRSRFTGEPRRLQIRQSEVPRRGIGKRSATARGSAPGRPRAQARPPFGLEGWTPGTFVCALLPWTGAERRRWARGPGSPGGPRPFPGKRAARAARPGSRRSEAARWAPSHGSRARSQQEPGGIAIVFGEHINPRADPLRTQVSSRRPFGFL